MSNPAGSLVEQDGTARTGENPPPPTGEKPTAEGSGGNGLVRVTVNLTKRSHRDLQRLTEETGLGKTDVLNRAVQVYALVENLLNDGEGELIVTRKDGSQQRIFIL